MEMAELLEKASQTISFVESDLAQAYKLAARIDRPEGRTPADKMMTAHLLDLLAEARKLQSRLANIA